AEALVKEAGVLEVVYNRGTLSGRAFYKGKRIRVPEPTTRRRLVIFAHECAHIAIGHRPTVPKHRNEYDAERWAQDALRRHGVAVPKKEQERAKKYVAWKIKQAIRRGAKSLDRETFAWCRDYLPTDMQRKGEKLLSPARTKDRGAKEKPRPSAAAPLAPTPNT